MGLADMLTGLALVVDGASFCLLKRLCLLVILWIVAVIDAKEYRVPNKIIIWGLIGKVLIAFLEMICKVFVAQEFFLEIIAVVFLVCISGVCRMLMKNSLGAGDIKLLVIMALYLGWQEIWSAVFLSLVCFLVMATLFVVTKKKSKNDAIPFGPAFAVGTSVTVLFSL